MVELFFAVVLAVCVDIKDCVERILASTGTNKESRVSASNGFQYLSIRQLPLFVSRQPGTIVAQRLVDPVVAVEQCKELRNN